MTKDRMTAEVFFEKEEKRERMKKRIQLLCIPLYYLVYIPLLVLCWRNDRIEFNVTLFLTFLLIAPGVYYLNLFKPDLVFDIEYFFKADVESASPSEWFYSCCKISAYVSLMIGPAIAAFMLIFNVR